MEIVGQITWEFELETDRVLQTLQTETAQSATNLLVVDGQTRDKASKIHEIQVVWVDC